MPHPTVPYVLAAPGSLTGGSDWELLLSGPKWFDTRASKGGGGAVDLVMHLWGVPFKKAAEMLKMSGLYQLPYGMSFSGSVQHFTGFPENTTVLVGSNTVTLTQVSQSLVVEPRGTTRLPIVNSVDISLRKALKISGFKVEPVMDVFNIFNNAAVQARTTQLGPTYGQAANILRGRLIKLGANVNF